MLVSDGGDASVCRSDYRRILWLTSKPAKLAPFYVGANIAEDEIEKLLTGDYG